MPRTAISAFGALVVAAVVAGSLAQSAAASHLAGYTGAYRGRSAQGIAIGLGPSRSSVRVFRYRARMTCTDGSTFLDDYFTDQVRIVRARFSSRVSSSHGAVLTTVTGTVHGLRAHGTIHIVERYSELADPAGNTPLAADGAIVCDSRLVRWTASGHRSSRTRH